MALPTLTPDQRERALVKATEARKARGALIAAVKSGTLSLTQVLDRGDEAVVKKTRIAQVLRALPGYGPAKVTALMAASGVDEKRRVGGLTTAQRARLIEGWQRRSAVGPIRLERLASRLLDVTVAGRAGNTQCSDR